jgi:hypothetical protein
MANLLSGVHSDESRGRYWRCPVCGRVEYVLDCMLVPVCEGTPEAPHRMTDIHRADPGEVPADKQHWFTFR